MDYKISRDWTAVSLLTGVSIGAPFSITNAGRAGDLIEVIVQSEEPGITDRGEPLAQLKSYNISGQPSEIWIRHIRYDLNGRILPEPAKLCTISIQYQSYITEQGGTPLDAITDDGYGSQRIKTSTQDSRISALKQDRLHSIVANYTIQAGNLMGVNISPASDLVISKVTCTPSLPIELFDEYATGSADGIFNPVNLNLCSADHSPTSAQVFYGASNSGNGLISGMGVIDTFIMACESSTPCVMVKNTGGLAQDVRVQVLFEETGPRNPSFGLMASTQLTATTDMSQYG